MEDDDWDDVLVPISVEEVLALQAKDEEPIRLAVEEVLLPSLEGEALHLGRAIVEMCGAYNLYAATEAVSSFLHRYLVRNPTHQICMDRFGEIRTTDSFTLVLTSEQLVLEVARFTDLWSEDDDSPATSTFVMVHWITKTLKYQPRLLQHFVATVPDNLPYCFILTKVDPKDQVEDCRQRWCPSLGKES